MAVPAAPPLPPALWGSSLDFRTSGKAVLGGMEVDPGRSQSHGGAGFPKSWTEATRMTSFSGGCRLEPGQRLGELIGRFPGGQCCLPRKAGLVVTRVGLAAGLLLLQPWGPALGTQPWGPSLRHHAPPRSSTGDGTRQGSGPGHSCPMLILRNTLLHRNSTLHGSSVRSASHHSLRFPCLLPLHLPGRHAQDPLSLLTFIEQVLRAGHCATLTS